MDINEVAAPAVNDIRDMRCRHTREPVVVRLSILPFHQRFDGYEVTLPRCRSPRDEG